jgi:ribosome maturation factor RimP
MPSRADIIKKLEELAQPKLSELGLELVEIEFGSIPGSKLVRFIIDSPDGVNIDHCEEVNRFLSDELDLHEELIPGSYSLEVSSPGLDRPFKKLADYRRNLGKKIKVVTRVPIQGQNVFIGLLEEIKAGKSEEEGVVVLQEKETEPSLEFNLEDIAVAHLDIDWDSFFGGSNRKTKRGK